MVFSIKTVWFSSLIFYGDTTVSHNTKSLEQYHPVWEKSVPNQKINDTLRFNKTEAVLDYFFAAKYFNTDSHVTI